MTTPSKIITIYPAGSNSLDIRSDREKDWIVVILYLRGGWGTHISSAKNQKAAIADQRCCVENQKGTIAIDFVQQ